jgi:hypothetical protein
MTEPGDILQDLKSHLALCHELLAVVEREGQALRRPVRPSLDEFYQLRKSLLSRLNPSLDSLHKHRIAWQKVSLEERTQHPEVGRLLRQNQDVTMKIILLDRENEQLLLRHGLVPPRELPRAARQRPQKVADFYRRQGSP